MLNRIGSWISNAWKNITHPYGDWSALGMLGGGYWARSTSGQDVTPDIAMRIAAWHACLKTLSEDVAKIGVRVFVRSSDGKVYDPSNSVNDLLGRSANETTTAYVLRETLTQWAAGWGNGYAEIERDGTGQPVALYPIHPTNCGLMYDADGRTVLQVALGGGEYKYIPYSDVLHIRGLGDGRCGYSVIQYAAETLGTALATTKYAGKFFENDGTPGVVLVHPGAPGAQALTALKESWKRQHVGVDNAHNPAVLFDGVKIERMSANPEDAQLLELREFSVPEICRFFRMPPHKVQDLSRATFSNIEHQGLSYVNDTLMPWLIRWEQEVDRKLLDGPGNLILRHDTRDLLRGDAASRASYYATMIQNGIMSVNEARDFEDLNPLPDGQGGNEHWRQLNMTRLNAPEEDTQ